MQTDLTRAHGSVTLIFFEYEGSWLMAKKLMAAHTTGIVLLISVQRDHAMTQIYYELNNTFQCSSNY